MEILAGAELPLELAIPAAGFAYFFAHLACIIAPEFRRVFLGRYGRRHRLVGLVYIAWLLLGYRGLLAPRQVVPQVWYNVVFSVLGICLTLTAAFDFRHHHSRVQNAGSGTLEEDTTVTFSEMVEHSFYHVLNLFQIVYLHVVCLPPSAAVPLGRGQRLGLAMAATSPWLFRSLFPVNSFSDNYNTRKTGKGPWTLIAVLYRLKKYQYMFYKHFLLHGLNLTVAVRGQPTRTSAGEVRPPLTDQPTFQLYWLALNTAYVMEFFLQTLVKRRVLSQTTMLGLNQLLMAVSTAAAVQVLAQVDLCISALSLLLNMVHRHRPFGELVNFVSVMAVSIALDNAGAALPMGR